MMRIKESLKNLKPYTPNQHHYHIKLDANESKNYLFKEGIDFKQVNLNLYPDSYSSELRKRISDYIHVKPELIIAGNGSSEMIELILKTYINPNDIVLSFEPSFSMYRIYTQIHQGDFKEVLPKEGLRFDMEDMIEQAKKLNPKLIFICSPNNPTGQLFDIKDIINLHEHTQALICLDEAYMEFTKPESSMVKLIESYDRLIVLRTLSKAFGLAGIRLGYLVSNQDIVDTLNLVKSPYNLNTLSQAVGIYALSQIDVMKQYTHMMIKQREIVEDALSKLDIKLYPSQANFVFFKSKEEELFQKLLTKGILIRSFSGSLKSYYRITIGEENENQILIKALKEILR